MKMDLAARKIFLIQQLLDAQKESVLDKVEEALKYEGTTLSYAQKNAIDEGIESLDNGRSIPHEEVLNILNERHPKYFKKND